MTKISNIIPEIRRFKGHIIVKFKRNNITEPTFGDIIDEMHKKLFIMEWGGKEFTILVEL